MTGILSLIEVVSGSLGGTRILFFQTEEQKNKKGRTEGKDKKGMTERKHKREE